MIGAGQLFIAHSSYAADLSHKETQVQELIGSFQWLTGGSLPVDLRMKLTKDNGDELVAKAKQFIDDPTNKKVLASPAGRRLQEMHSRLSNYFVIDKQFEECMKNKKSSKDLDKRIDKASFENIYISDDISVPCISPAMEFESLKKFYKNINAVTQMQNEATFQTKLYEKSMENAAKTLMALRYTYDENFLKDGNTKKQNKKDAENIVNKLCDHGQSCSPQTYKHLNKFSQNEMSIIKKTNQKVGFTKATTILNKKIDRLNKKIDGISINVEQGIYVPGWDTSDPIYDDKNTQKQFENYKAAYIKEVEDKEEEEVEDKRVTGVGLLLLTDKIKEESGGLREFKDDKDLIENKKFIGNTTFQVKKHKKTDIAKVRLAKQEIETKIKIQATRLNKMDKDKRRKEKSAKKSGNQYDSLNPLTVDTVELSADRKIDIARLIKTNPAAVGEILIKNPTYGNIVCDAIIQIENDDVSDKEWDQVFLWGGVAVGVALVGTGVGALAGGYILAGTSAAVTFGTVATASFIAGTAVGVGEGVYYSSRSYDHYQDMIDLEGAYFAGSGDEESIAEKATALKNYKEARFTAGLAIGFSVVDLGGLRAAATLSNKSIQLAQRAGKTLSPTQVKVLTTIYKAVADNKVSAKLAQVVKLMGKAGGHKLDKFLTLLADSSQALRKRFLDSLSTGKMTPEKIRKLVDEALEAAEKGCAV